jgi:hypothetical protein
LNAATLPQRLERLAQGAQSQFAEIVKQEPWADFSPAQKLLGRIALELSTCLDLATSDELRAKLEEALVGAESLAEEGEEDDEEVADPEARIAAFWNEVDGFIEELGELARHFAR